MRKRAFRHDTVSWTPPTGEKYVTAEDAGRALLDESESAEAARLRMLDRKGLTRKDPDAAQARERMIQRRQPKR